MAPVGLTELVAGQIARHGPLPFDQLMELALYHERWGFYASGGAAGRRGDFITSVEVGPLFGAVVARALDRRWEALGQPDPFVVVEAGAGVGTLARSILLAAPACLGALTYVMVERSRQLRDQQGNHLALSDPSHALPPARDTETDDAVGTDAGTGPRLVSVAGLPGLRFRGVVLANELLDNLPCHLLEYTPSGWAEVRVGLADHGDGFREHLVPATTQRRVAAQALVPKPGSGVRIPLQVRAGEWVGHALSLLEAGSLILFDYGSETADMAGRPIDQWLRTYRGHAMGASPLEHLGEQDITCEVAFDQLTRVRRPTSHQSQAAFLDGLGIMDLVDEGRRVWRDRAHLGDLEAVRARSRIGEAEALVDPAGLGAFRVVEWVS